MPPMQNGAELEGKASRRLGALLLLLLRGAALCSSASAAAAALTAAALRRAPFRFLLAADAIVAVYSAVEAGAAAWEVATGATLMPEALQLWFDFGHDQVITNPFVNVD
jgi:serine/threonine protein kinase HipA of HipAB toxin-antitoxin module